MSTFRHYRGLHGETISVPGHTISDAHLGHDMEPFPFVKRAERLGDRRDRFASICRFAPWIDDALANKAVRRMLAP